MNQLATVLIAVAAGICLACLSMFVLQMTLFDAGDWVYKKLDGRSGMTLAQKSYFIFALLGLLVCVGAGIYCLPWFLPDNWGGFDEDGEFTPIRVTFSALGTILLGGGLASLVLETVRSRWTIQRRLEDIDHLENQIKNRDGEAYWHSVIARTEDDQQKLVSLKDQLLKKVDQIAKQKTTFTADYIGYLNRELHSSQVQRYGELIKTIDRRLELCQEQVRLKERDDRIQELRRTIPVRPPQTLI